MASWQERTCNEDIVTYIWKLSDMAIDKQLSYQGVFWKDMHIYTNKERA
jgi:hypothetical protein